MKTLAGVVPVALVALVGAFVIAPSEDTEVDQAQVEAEVLEWAEAWMDSWNADVHCGATLPLIHPDHVVGLTGGAPLRKADWLDHWSCPRLVDGFGLDSSSS